MTNLSGWYLLGQPACLRVQQGGYTACVAQASARDSRRPNADGESTGFIRPRRGRASAATSSLVSSSESNPHARADTSNKPTSHHQAPRAAATRQRAKAWAGGGKLPHARPKPPPCRRTPTLSPIQPHASVPRHHRNGQGGVTGSCAGRACRCPAPRARSAPPLPAAPWAAGAGGSEAGG